MTVDVVPKVVTFAKHTPVIQLVVENESSKTENSEESQGNTQQVSKKEANDKWRQWKDCEKMSKAKRRLNTLVIIINNMTLINNYSF